MAPSKIQASSSNILLDPSECIGLTHAENVTKESAEKASDLLMLNHARYHAYFNMAGLHNHIAHHLMSLYALGATPDEMQKGYDDNKGYQVAQGGHTLDVAHELHDPKVFDQHLGKHEYYGDFLKFFTEEIESKGVPTVVNEYVFRGDERADNMLSRMHAGFLHPIIHLGYGLEFNQACLVAEAFASASIHDTKPSAIVFPAEKYQKSNPPSADVSILSLVSELRNDPTIYNAVKHEDPVDKLTFALLPRALDPLVKIISQFTCPADEESLKKKTAEMIHMSAFIAAGAQNPSKEPAIDFFIMHSMNLSVFYPVFMSLDWLSVENKARLLNWKVWQDLSIYSAAKVPELYLDRIQNYQPKHPGDWATNIIPRSNKYGDDGHCSKFIRATLNAKNVSKPYYGQPGFPLKEEDFLQIAHMCMDSVERLDDPDYKLPGGIGGEENMYSGIDDQIRRTIVRWVRWAGLNEAWEYVPDLDEKARL